MGWVMKIIIIFENKKVLVFGLVWFGEVVVCLLVKLGVIVIVNDGKLFDENLIV